MNLFPHHVLVWVSGMKRAITFYTNILGLIYIRIWEFFKLGVRNFGLLFVLVPHQWTEGQNQMVLLLSLRPMI